MKIEFNKGLETTVDISKIDGSTITVYSIKPIGVQNYCSKHNGVVMVDGIVEEWHEECICDV